MSRPKSNPIPEIVPTANGSFIEQMPVPTNLRKAAFRDEQGADIYTFEVPTTSGVVYAREMDDETYAEFVSRCKAVVAALRAPSENEDRAQELDKAGKHDESAKLRQQLQDGYRDAQHENARITRWTLEKTVAGWSYSRPFSVTAFGQLNGDDQQTVLLQIIQKSGIGREDSDFLVEDLLAL